MVNHHEPKERTELLIGLARKALHNKVYNLAYVAALQAIEAHSGKDSQHYKEAEQTE